MTEMEMKDEIETEEFTDELSDEALDREGDGRFVSAGPGGCGPFCPPRAPSQ